MLTPSLVPVMVTFTFCAVRFPLLSLIVTAKVSVTLWPAASDWTCADALLTW